MLISNICSSQRASATSYPNLVKLWLKSRCGKKTFRFARLLQVSLCTYGRTYTQTKIEEGNEIIH